ncbi:peptidylprolyl isomerase [Pseudoalteromonas sp. MMG024]|uniref:peptidylprolyl isomerase n=1 Tax=Pseudoalteromonas sp. MMG024 TaxID=2909980 RepID=UPI001F017ED8|nr:peptidylprolyl isomerase [Pseudoalteromonas sp. MMG024]MCF6455895.1 peptidylprolyl isomerase [Pseudoalteromonas sp. MMG024]
MDKLKLSLLAAGLFAGAAQATIVEVQTTQGNFQINLFDETTPKTVENFLKYVNDERYNEVVFHRLITNFVLQGGGYTYEGSKFIPIDTYGTVVNEPVYSNVRGTIAMAKVENDSNSATSQWFINLKDNSGDLDLQNGGFTVFGQVIGEGMDLIDQLSNFECNTVPLTNTTNDECADFKNGNASLGAERLITIENVTIIDSNTDTASDLTPKENTLIKEQPKPPVTSDDSGGSFGALLGLMASALIWRRKRKPVLAR